MRRCSRQRPKHQEGLSLLEVLLALLVLTVGLLGLAAMQELAVHRSIDANELSLATNLAAEMIERIQYNPKHAASYDGVSVSAANNPCGTITDLMARGDCLQWRERLLKTSLPSPSGTVTVRPTGPPGLSQWLITVQISWSGLLVPLSFSAVVTP
jgi:type IV pilus assembly protein PilV